MIKAVVDWFALEGAASIIYTTGSSFGKTAAESSSVINIDLNRKPVTCSTRNRRNSRNRRNRHPHRSQP